MNLREALDEANRDREAVETVIHTALVALAIRTGCDIQQATVHIVDATQMMDTRQRLKVAKVEITLSLR